MKTSVYCIDLLQCSHSLLAIRHDCIKHISTCLSVLLNWDLSGVDILQLRFHVLNRASYKHLESFLKPIMINGKILTDISGLWIHSSSPNTHQLGAEELPSYARERKDVQLDSIVKNPGGFSLTEFITCNHFDHISWVAPEYIWVK